jgi:hypothetical protein
VTTTELVPVEPGNRIRLPADWVEALGLPQLVRLERTSEGILFRPCPAVTWKDIFATRLTIGSAPPRQEDGPEGTPDEFLF